MQPHFRRDIEIARGVAVLAVFTFHLVPWALPSGFLGVDIFFVLSGYLMSAVYGAGGPGAARTYFIKRGRRILPAYLVALVGIVVVATLLTLPHELADVERHAIYALLLIPNVGYWLDGSYFANAIFRPALHFWSLGVELQFYLLVPILVALMRRRPWVIWLAIAASLAACFAIVEVRPRYAFFLTPFRVWEFLIGFAAHRFGPEIAAIWKPSSPARTWIGLAAILAVVPLMLWPIPETAHPKWAALGVSLATAALLVLGLPERAMLSPPGRLLTLAGTYSYAIYLVHFPVIAFWFYRPFGAGTLFVAGPVDIAAIVALTLVLSFILFQLVETPWRRERDLGRLALGAAAISGVATLSTIFSLPLKLLFVSPEVATISAAWLDRGHDRCGKFALLATTPTCLLTPAVDSRERRFVLVGDSHAEALKEALAEAAERAGASLSFLRANCTVGAGACIPELLADMAETEGFGTIVVHSLGPSMRPEAIGRLAETAHARGTRVVVVAPVPTWPGHVPEALYREAIGDGRADWLDQTLGEHEARQRATAGALGSLVAKGVRVYNPAPLLCRPLCVTLTPDGKPTYFDSGHMTISGAHLLEPLLASIVAAK